MLTQKKYKISLLFYKYVLKANCIFSRKNIIQYLFTLAREPSIIQPTSVVTYCVIHYVRNEYMCHWKCVFPCHYPTKFHERKSMFQARRYQISTGSNRFDTNCLAQLYLHNRFESMMNTKLLFLHIFFLLVSR